MIRILIYTLTCLLIMAGTNAFSAQDIAGDTCSVRYQMKNTDWYSQSLTLGEISQINLPAGQSKMKLSCHLSRESAFSFDSTELIDFSIDSDASDVQRLSASQPLFLLPSGTFFADFSLDMHNDHEKSIHWLSIEQAFHQEIVSNITMGAFYGLCLVLIIYVFLMAETIGDRTFKLYSLYIFCAASFFLLQEGQLNIILPQHSFLLGHNFYLLFAGLTVLSATLFIVDVTELRTTWPNLTKFGICPTACSVMLIAVIMIVLDHGGLSGILGIGMAYLTLLIMFTILCLVSIQTYRKVSMAWLVLLSLLSMVFAMMMRVLPLGASSFVSRYGLIIAFACEALIFAIVVTSRIRHMQKRGKQAEQEANTDMLCTVLNRRGWLYEADKLLQAQEQNSSLIGLLYIDLDDFKRINDSFGHDAGDRVLRNVSQTICSHVQQSHKVGRVGGDEFVVLGLFDSERAFNDLANTIRKSLNHQTLLISKELKLDYSASVGHVISNQCTSVTDLLHLADQSMYEMKRSKLAEACEI